MSRPKPFPPKVDVNPDNAKVRPAGEAVPQEPVHEAAQAASKADRLSTLRHALNIARRTGKHERAEHLVAQITELEKQP
jgi:hypothetical protein